MVNRLDIWMGGLLSLSLLTYYLYKVGALTYLQAFAALWLLCISTSCAWLSWQLERKVRKIYKGGAGMVC